MTQDELHSLSWVFKLKHKTMITKKNLKKYLKMKNKYFNFPSSYQQGHYTY